MAPFVYSAHAKDYIGISLLLSSGQSSSVADVQLWLFKQCLWRNIFKIIRKMFKKNQKTQNIRQTNIFLQKTLELVNPIKYLGVIID